MTDHVFLGWMAAALVVLIVGIRLVLWLEPWARARCRKRKTDRVGRVQSRRRVT